MSDAAVNLPSRETLRAEREQVKAQIAQSRELIAKSRTSIAEGRELFAGKLRQVGRKTEASQARQIRRVS